MRQEGEPSVEEILDSIKKVIARDNRESAAPEREHGEGTLAGGVAVSGEDLAEDDPGEVLDLGAAASEVMGGDEHEDTLAGDYPGDRGFGQEDTESEALTNAHSADAMRQSFAALAMLSEPSAAPQIVRSGETSLEGLVREMLRPMLAQWLDANLPDMVERMVKAEIARIAGKKG